MKAYLAQHIARNLDQLSSILQRYNHEVVSGVSVRKTVASLVIDPEIDLVLCDINIPDQGALPFLQYVRSTPRFEWLPIIVTGNQFQNGLVERCLKMGANDIAVLPATEEAIVAKLDKAALEGRRTVLLVTPEPTLADHFGNFLEIERFRVLLAASADQAVEILERENVNVVVSDIVLPGMDGLGLLATVKEMSERIPVILITGFEGKSSPTDAIAAGADGYFDCPFVNTEMIGTLRRLLAINSATPRSRGHHIVTSVARRPRPKR
jgi:CheY-like chemotaxis protein